MYAARLRILVALCLLVLAVCVLRLMQMQLLSREDYLHDVARLQRDTIRRIPTLRGEIRDRHGRVLAVDQLRFEIHISYSLASSIDPRPHGSDSSKADAEADRLVLEDAIIKCRDIFAADPDDIFQRIRQRNDSIWDIRMFQAWRTNFPDSELLRNADPASVSLAAAMDDFARRQPDEQRRLRLARRTDIIEMHRSFPIATIDGTEQLMAAQVEFMDHPGVSVHPVVTRVYPWDHSAAQLIGWVGPAAEPFMLPLSDQELLQYTPDELCGRSGVEYTAEAVLRGRRGRRVYNFDRKLIEEIDRQPGHPVTLAIDIELHRRIEAILADPTYNLDRPKAAVVVADVWSDEIIALVSIPSFDLNAIRRTWNEQLNDENRPLVNRPLENLYPPGSVAKPIVLIAGLEEGKITESEVISCPSHAAPTGWPNCWLFRQSGIGHDVMWQNDAIHAMRGSCNPYFSRLADRVESDLLRKWFLNLGLGRKVLAPAQWPSDLTVAEGTISLPQRQIPESEGIVHSHNSPGRISAAEKRLFAIGQGNIRSTPVQVAAQMAVIARRGLFRPLRLFLLDPRQPFSTTDLGISPNTMSIIRRGMYEVVNVDGGTAYKTFRNTRFSDFDVTVYGKTGSTQNPEHAWFGGFAEDSSGRALAFAIVIEGGQSGAQDAAPVAREILRACIDAGYIGRSTDPRPELQPH